LVLARVRDHLLGPWIADVPADDHELGKVQRELVDVGNRPAGLRRARRPGVPNLGAERHPELVIVGGHIGYPWTEEMVAVRSEERRVGKECRSRWWTYQ